MKEIILKHLNEIGTDLEESYGDKLILLEGKDFEEFAEKLVKKLTIPVVVKSSYCKCTQPSMQKPISETEYECFDCGKEVKK